MNTVAFIIGFGALLLIATAPYLLASYSNEQLANIQKWVDFAVKAAEVIYASAKQGKFKKEYVLNFIKKKFKSLAPEDLEVLIEGAVESMILSCNQNDTIENRKSF